MPTFRQKRGAKGVLFGGSSSSIIPNFNSVFQVAQVSVNTLIQREKPKRLYMTASKKEIKEENGEP